MKGRANPKKPKHKRSEKKKKHKNIQKVESKKNKGKGKGKDQKRQKNKHKINTKKREHQHSEAALISKQRKPSARKRGSITKKVNQCITQLNKITQFRIAEHGINAKPEWRAKLHNQDTEIRFFCTFPAIGKNPISVHIVQPIAQEIEMCTGIQIKRIKLSGRSTPKKKFDFQLEDKNEYELIASDSKPNEKFEFQLGVENKYERITPDTNKKIRSAYKLELIIPRKLTSASSLSKHLSDEHILAMAKLREITNKKAKNKETWQSTYTDDKYEFSIIIKDLNTLEETKTQLSKLFKDNFGKFGTITQTEHQQVLLTISLTKIEFEKFLKPFRKQIRTNEELQSYGFRA